MTERPKGISIAAVGEVHAFDLLAEVIPELLHGQVGDVCIRMKTMYLDIEDGDRTDES